ncbi:MAG: toll/interleukin-1 receptor domain-containing protein [Lachnospiraceae bacterium]|nr:toll/interleukin-1 receptor domain-containing protein [Lachnospiraceae bacterium]
MAYIFGNTSAEFSEAENYVFEFLKNSLPDYITVAVCPQITDSEGRMLEIDFLIFIPHMGIYLLDIKGAVRFGYSNGEYFYEYRNGRRLVATGQKRHDRIVNQNFELLKFLKKKYNLTPLVYEFECFPFIVMDGMDEKDLPPSFDPRHVLTASDFNSAMRFLHKLIGCTIYMQEQHGIGVYEDLTDKDVHDISFFWERGVAEPFRPGRPPVVFLSYNRNNNEMSKMVQTALQDRGIYVWRAPKDVPVGVFYLDNEMEAIEQCDVFLILLSIPAQKSEEVRKEFKKALELDKPILPVWVQDIKDDEIDEYYRENLTRYQYRIMPVMDSEVIEEIVDTVGKIKRDKDKE